MATICPECERSDKITKISAIYTGGISSGTYQGPSVGVSTPIGKGQSHVSGGHTTLRGSNQSLMSELLAPPKKPQGKKWSGCAILALIPLIIVAFFELFITYEDGFEFGIVSAIIAIAIIVNQNKRINQGKEELAEEYPRWERAMRRWDLLYYCERDDVLFNPSTGETLRVSEMMDYLYS